MERIKDGVFIGTQLDKKTFEKLRRITFEKNISKSSIVRKLLEDWIKKEEKKWMIQNQ